MSQLSRLIPTSGPGSGTVTSISAGTGITLTPNPITTTGTVALTIPVTIADGGTNAITMANTDGVIIFDGTRLVTTVAGTTGQVLTGVTGSAPTFQSPAASSITITGDSGGGLTGNSFTFTGGSTGLTFSGAVTTETLTGILVVSNGGTGRATLTNHGLLVGAGTAAITQLADATNGQLPIGSTGADPVLATLTAGANITITNGAGSITIAAESSSQVVNYTGITHLSSPYTVLSTDYYISADVTGGVITILLPNAPSTGRIFVIKDKVGASFTSNITVTTVGGSVDIDGATSYTMNTNYTSIQLIFNGTSYEIY